MNNAINNTGLTKAKSGKNDEFYTQYADIEKEMNAYLDFDGQVFKGKVILLPCDDPTWSNFTLYFAQNFSRLGIKKLICTSYAHDSKGLGFEYTPHPEEADHTKYNPEKSQTQGKIFTLTKDLNNDGQIDVKDLDWDYLDGDGDFRSQEVMALRDEADIIITNPPFSLFREFLAWIVQADKQFSIIGNMNAITYKDVFPLIANNQIWLGSTISSGDREFAVPSNYPLNAAGFRVDDNGQKYIRVKGVRWFTNIEHGRRHEPLQLMTMDDNLKFNKKLVSKTPYQEYDNYKAIEVPFTNAIPSDYSGVMGVPISFLDKYNPDQFEILNANDFRRDENFKIKPHGLIKDKDGAINGKPTYARILIRHKGM